MPGLFHCKRPSSTTLQPAPCPLALVWSQQKLPNILDKNSQLMVGLKSLIRHLCSGL